MAVRRGETLPFCTDIVYGKESNKMNNRMIRYIQKAYYNALRIPLRPNSRFVFMSDCHRGDGSAADDFRQNQNLYLAALHHYNRDGYTYVELGDGDELWKNKNCCTIMEAHDLVFDELSCLYQEGRAFFLYGNHDMVKKKKKTGQNYQNYFSECRRCYCPLFPDVVFHESIILQRPEKKGEVLLLHGHQADFFNNCLWKLGRFLVRYFWRPLELLGVKNPTETSVRNQKQEVVEQLLSHWAQVHQTVLIAGHTHKTSFGEEKSPFYYNDGCCVHTGYITCLELEDENLTLVRWSAHVRENGTLYIGRDVLAGPKRLFP